MLALLRTIALLGKLNLCVTNLDHIIPARYFQKLVSTMEMEKKLLPSNVEFHLQCEACQMKDQEKLGEGE